MSAPFTADLDVAREETHAAWFGELSTARAELEELVKERRIGGTTPAEPDDTLGLRAELLLATDEVAEIKGALARERARVAHADGDEGFWAEMRDGLRRDLELAERETTVELEDLSGRPLLPRSEFLALERWAGQRATQAAGPPLRAAKTQEEDAAQDALLSAWQRELAARAAVADLERERGRAQERARQAAVAVSELEARLTAAQMRMQSLAKALAKARPPPPEETDAGGRASALHTAARFQRLSAALDTVATPIERETWCALTVLGGYAHVLAGEPELAESFLDTGAAARGGACRGLAAAYWDLPELREAWVHALYVQSGKEPARVVVDRDEGSWSVDGDVIVGTARVELQLRPGRHRVEVARPDGRLVSTTLDTASGERVAVVVEGPWLEVEPFDAPWAGLPDLPPRRYATWQATAAPFEPELPRRAEIRVDAAWVRFDGRDHTGFSVSASWSPIVTERFGVLVGLGHEQLQGALTIRYTESLATDALLRERAFAGAVVRVGPTSLGLTGLGGAIPMVGPFWGGEATLGVEVAPALDVVARGGVATSPVSLVDGLEPHAAMGLAAKF